MELFCSYPIEFKITIARESTIFKSKNSKINWKMNDFDPEKIVAALQLEPHPEGGYFRENYRSQESISQKYLPARFSGSRSFSTAIYYLLVGEQFSTLHRIKQDEVWHFYLGSTLKIHEINSAGQYREIKLGQDWENGETMQAIVAQNSCFAAELGEKNKNNFALVGCTVAPGFDFEDFEIGKRKDLLDRYPEYKEIIQKMTK